MLIDGSHNCNSSRVGLWRGTIHIKHNVLNQRMQRLRFLISRTMQMARLLLLLIVALTNFACAREPAPQVLYSHEHRESISVHSVSIPLQSFELTPVLSRNQAQSLSELPKLVQQVAQHSETPTPTVAVNASFWSAKTSFPIGPTAFNGEWITIDAYKTWNSLVLENSQPSIAHIQPNLTLSVGDKDYAIQSVNVRRNDDDVVLYNHFAGSSVPWLDSAGVGELWQDNVRNAGSSFGDNSERETDSVTFVQHKSREFFERQQETSTHKVLLRYIGQPTLQGETKAVCMRAGSGVFQVMPGYMVVSGTSLTHVNPGDTLVLHSSTGTDKAGITDIVTSTPRLVRNGQAKPEPEADGTTSKRFINGEVPRTAFGWNRSRDTVYFVCVTSSTPGGYYGASLQQLAEIMVEKGCYNAINLDGGGSTCMAIDGELVTSYTGKQPRRISTALAALPIVSPKRSAENKP